MLRGSYRRLCLHSTVCNTGFITSVRVKDTNQGQCHNGDSECPQRYLQSTINTYYVRRALTHCSPWNTTHEEPERLTQVLVNNGYKNSDVNKIIKKTVNKMAYQRTTPTSSRRRYNYATRNTCHLNATKKKTS